MSEYEIALQNLALYPRWLVALVTVVLAAVAVWVIAKLLKWTIYLAAFLAFGCIVVGVLAWWIT